MPRPKSVCYICGKPIMRKRGSEKRICNGWFCEIEDKEKKQATTTPQAPRPPPTTDEEDHNPSTDSGKCPFARCKNKMIDGLPCYLHRCEGGSWDDPCTLAKVGSVVIGSESYYSDYCKKHTCKANEHEVKCTSMPEESHGFCERHYYRAHHIKGRYCFDVHPADISCPLQRGLDPFYDQPEYIGRPGGVA